MGGVLSRLGRERYAGCLMVRTEVFANKKLIQQTNFDETRDASPYLVPSLKLSRPALLLKDRLVPSSTVQKAQRSPPQSG